MRVLVLGNKGMLGNCVERKLRNNESINTFTTNYRWPNSEFVDFVILGKFDCIINCIAKIPSSGVNNDADYFVTNFALPVFLASNCKKLIHASSDILDDSPYSVSKNLCDSVLSNFKNSHVIKCSLVGIEKENNRSLLSKFLNSKEKSWSGYCNYMWDGITTLEWANIAELILFSKIKENLIIPYSTIVSKYDLLVCFSSIFEKNIDIVPLQQPYHFFKNKDGDFFCGDISSMLLKLKIFYDEKR